MIRYKKRKSNLPIAVTVVILVLLIIFSHRNPNSAKVPSNLLNMVISPINGIFYSVSDGIRSIYDNVFGEKSSGAKVNALETENMQLKDELRRMEQVIKNDDILRREYELLTKDANQYIPAKVTGKDGSNTFVRFTIDSGSAKGVEVGDIVVEGTETKGKKTAAGLVGRVTEVGVNYAKVSSILDRSNNFSVMFQDSASYGIINARDDETFFGYMLDAQKPLRIGEEVMTSGMGGIYPRGFYIGEVVDITTSSDDLTKSFSITSPVDFNVLYRVLVFKNTLKEQADE